MSISPQYRGRIAPTPSGFLHAGHLATFRTACERARQRGGVVVFRMEDIDLDRCTREYAEAAVEDLRAEGLTWQEGVGAGGGEFAPYEQSLRFGYYWSLVERLSEAGLLYVSDASRADVKKLGAAPKRVFGFCEPEPIFPQSLRAKPAKASDVRDAKAQNWRFAVPRGRAVEFFDNNFGAVKFVAGEDFGDFLVWRKRGAPSYELAVVADDAAMKITEVVRGADLLLSTARQILLYEALGFDIPEFFHCPLVRGENGEKISKSTLKNLGENGWLIGRRKAPR